MFTQDFRSDFDAITKADRPFALVRFGDGEHAILERKPYRSADAWRTNGKVWLARGLLETLKADLEGFCLGIPTPCCASLASGLRNAVRAPLSRCTFSTIFLHANLRRFSEIRRCFDDAVVVGSWYGDIRIPSDGVTKPWDLDAVVTRLLEVDRPILVAAGPCANLLIHRYWTRQDPRKRVTILDVGSAMDVAHGKKTRYYHDRMHNHACDWAMAIAMRKRHATKMGAAEPTMRIPQRIRLGSKTGR